MRRPRSFRTGMACFVALCLLLAQLATAAYACPQWRGTAEAPGSALEHGSGPATAASQMMPGCDMAPATPMDPAQPGLCKAHCQADQQSHDPKASEAWHAPLLAVLWSLAWGLQAMPRPAATPPWGALAAGPPPGSPPLYLVHQVFRL